ncbi:MAG: hypothetical protein J7K73_01800 [Nanoarchaeota archaeon]|nr:hypothetical protein [Nanoarchaeota archaeon]
MISHFDEKLLKFIYHLSREQRYLNSIEAAEYLSNKGIKVTDRTVRRWFDFLKSVGFQYFPSPKYDSIGLDYAVVILFGVKNEGVFDIIPYDMYIDKVMSLSHCKHAYVCYYSVPFGKMNQFKEFWSTAKKMGIVKDFILLESKAATFIFSPFHKVITNGVISFEKVDEKDNEHFIKLLEENMKYTPSLDPHPLVKKNPFLVPVLLEYYRKHVSSIDVWNNLKEKLGDRVWKEYLHRFRRKSSDGRGVFFVQQALKLLKNNSDFVQQMRVIYDMIYISHNIAMMYAYVKLRKIEDVVELARKISKYGVHVNISLPRDNSKKEVLFYIVTNNKSIVKIVGTCLEFARARPYIFINDFDYSKKFWNEERFSLDYANLFDPRTCSWRYSHEVYISKLKELAS